jgi:hypothetical protein
VPEYLARLRNDFIDLRAQRRPQGLDVDNLLLRMTVLD